MANAAHKLPSAGDLIAAARLSFHCFIELAFPILHPGQKYEHAEYIETMGQLLQGVARGGKRRVIINLPPRHMKSMITSVFYPAWRLGCDPGAKFICISYGDDLAHELSSLTRRLMLSQLYRRIFPGTVLDKKAADHIKTTKGGVRYATSIGSDITGFGADTIIIDDPMQPDDAASEKAKERVRSWVACSVMTRFNDPSRGVLILVMHRLAPDDLSATLAAEGGYFVLALPLIAETVEKFESSKRKGLLMHRQPGEVLNPRRMSPEDVKQLQASLPPHVFAAQYQQRPTPGGSGMLSIERFRRYDLSNRPGFELLVHSWDVGATINGNASVCTVWGLLREPGGLDVVYLLNVIKIKAELPEVRAAIRHQDKKDRPALIIIDERGVGMGLCQELRREGLSHVTQSKATREPLQLDAGGTRPNASKVERFGQASLTIDDGRVVIPKEAPWLEPFLYEVASFPNIADNDQVDSMTQFVANLDRAAQMARRNRQRMN